jgi:hypothetical protein
MEVGITWKLVSKNIYNEKKTQINLSVLASKICSETMTEQQQLVITC